MDIVCVDSEPGFQLYEAFVRAHPRGSLWQSCAWKAYQRALGREVRTYLALEGEQCLAGALVSIDRTAMNLSTWEIPRGPLWAEGQSRAALHLLERILADARRDRCLRVYVSPSEALPHEQPWVQSSRLVQPEATLIVDLRPDHKEILAHMKPKGRYNIALAERHDLHVAESRDIDGFYSILQSTAGRDHFALHPKSQYKAFLEVLPGSFLLLSGTPGEAQKPIAGLLGVTWGNTGYYYYGASLHAYRALMAPYVLQWAAMRLCKARGCTQYDLLGVAPPDAGEGHPWRGITSFKEKFGGERVTYPPEQQYTLRPMAALILTVKRKMLG